MIFSLIAGWLTKRIWPTGVLVVLGISAASALIGFVRVETVVNPNLMALGQLPRPNGTGIVLAGFVIDAAINFVLFLAIWALRKKFRPHSEKPDLN